MGYKINHRQKAGEKKAPRNWEARDMILNVNKSGGPHVNKRDKRAKNPNKNNWDDES
jgi:hypothetical protein